MTARRLDAHGISVAVPPGWDARLGRRAPYVDRMAPATLRRGSAVVPFPQEQTHALLHMGNFALPEDRGDYGSGAVDVMGPSDVLIVLFDHGAEAAGTALYDHPLPRRLPAAAYNAWGLQRTIPGQSGVQRFFTEAGRGFCLYVVLGSHQRRTSLAPLVDEVLATIAIAPGATG